MNIRAFIVTLIAVLAAAEEPQNSLSRRLLGSSHLGAVSPPRIQFEVYKALIGETVRLECPQPNPTWFFRKASSSAANQEDLIVTRHGVINVDYKYKIMCHMSLKHKVIIVNNVEFEDEGLYTCLYTLPTAADDEYNQIATSSVQYRHVFNVTVYTLISGLTMSLKPISMQKAPIPSPSLRIFNLEKNRQPSPTDGSSVGGGGGLNGYELVDSSLTVRQNEEFFITCTVDSSRPAADIRFVMLDASESSSGGNSEDSPSGHPIQSLNSNSQLGYLTLSPNAFNGETMSSTAQPPQHSSIVESSSNVVGNADKTFKTVHTARLKVGRDDHGKMITCKAENGFSNQKWENKKLLNILFAPVCKDPPRHTYYVGINQTATIECNILTANPARVQFEWDLQNVNYYPPQPSSFMGIVKRQIGGGVMPSSLGASYTNDILSNDISGEGSQLSSSSILLGGGSVIGADKPYLEPTPIKPKFTGLVNEGLASRFKWRPTSMSDFGEIVCKATNEIGTTECVYEIRLGGVPNPPSECTHTVKNTSAIISCQVGFHQGDPDIYCYLLRKSDNGVYKEHTRNRESCSFIVNDVNVNKLNEFWIYSSNKHGHNKDNGVYLTIGQTSKPVQQYPSRNWLIFGFLAAVVVLIAAVCCFSFKFKKGTSDDNDSIFEGDNYQHSRGIMSSSQGVKKMSNSGGYSSKMIKGVKVSSQDAMFESSENQQKYVKIDFYPTAMDEEFIKQDYTDNSSTMKRRDLKQLQSGNYLPSETEFIESTTSGSAYYESKPTAPHKHSLTQYQPEYKSINEELKRKQKERTLLKTPNTQQQQINKSTSFSTKSSSPNDSSEKGLLTTVSNAKQAQTNNSNNDTSSSSCSSDKSSSSLSEGQSVNVAAAKMVTFSSNSMSRKTKSSTNTAETATTATTIVTTSTINGGGNNNEIGSASASATSTTSTGTSASPSVSLSSANNDLDVSHEAPLTVSDQSFVLQRPNKLTMPNPMSTFGPTNDTNKFRSPRRFINSTNNIKHQAPSVQLNGGAHPQLSVSSSISPPKSTTYASAAAAGTAGPVNSNNNNLDRIFSSSTTNTSSQFGSSKFSDIIESRFLNKLCEDIEVSLNVDFDCADDYSINDFSGDYSFDNDLKSPVTNGACKLPFSGKPGGPLNKHINKNAVAHAHVHQSALNGHSHAPKRPQPQSQSQDSSSPTKSQLGVLV